ncbi:MAG: Mur ligase domain-containing protein, partial [Planctomycetes bacterium]|nr:Mur ligase domain-containing protein [Planctomycetota bacterium]
MGVGGIGVSALAELALDAGAEVSGCDSKENATTRALSDRGIHIIIGHGPDHVNCADLLVYSSAVPENHPERMAAGIRQEKRGRFLARFLDERRSVGIAGTHGKTTTTWLLAHLLIRAGEDPAVFVGGMVPDLPDGNFRLGGGVFVAELDESDSSFLLPKLSTAIITNIESDHLS